MSRAPPPAPRRGRALLDAPPPPPPVSTSEWPTPPSCPGSDLCDPGGSAMTTTAPDVCDYDFYTTQGVMTIRAWRKLSPHGADRLYNLARLGYYDRSALYRVLPGYVVQFGIAADATVATTYDASNAAARVPDEGLNEAWGGTNGRYWVSYAGSGETSESVKCTQRTAELFINLADNAARFDPMEYAAFAKVIDGVEVMDRFYAGYGDVNGCVAHAEFAFACNGPVEATMYNTGISYVDASFPKLDRVGWVDVIPDPGDLRGNMHGEWIQNEAGEGALSWLMVCLFLVVIAAGYARRLTVNKKMGNRFLDFIWNTPSIRALVTRLSERKGVEILESSRNRPGEWTEAEEVEWTLREPPASPPPPPRPPESEVYPASYDVAP
ncbi:uncharacterized protein MICPUCDRAFT_50419 [Micromonas pusilla CCMP1545]|jgi:cyclophilin family peptidyl-prolyl cis-trans isomerase|uniref:Predicted protein n=1 Tax=Micromonas pusilla (strain CCMP1545) TaxID=564608 RepID=C1MI34_MICPC|nr:uncharacterized protein MICPUCDRAFT_50419 [Micromonas pusilla CCMP1545]EEH60849.1 predicted protein [Micromonas pusilla CCMP1545]|eukprot:XP_003055597.1 predicted protein [Micromonas pusilla CCMP1545]